MGMYTDFDVKVKLKPEFIPAIRKMLDNNKISSNCWKDLGYDFLENYALYSRSNFIPYGYVFDKKYENFLSEDGIWEFSCSLKNYDSTIEYFMENVLSKIIEEAYDISMYYEEWYSERTYKFDDNKFIIDSSEKTYYENGYW